MQYSLIEVTGANMESRFYANGIRISRAKLNQIKDNCKRLECFSTRAKQLPGGLIRRWNYSTATM